MLCNNCILIISTLHLDIKISINITKFERRKLLRHHSVEDALYCMNHGQSSDLAITVIERGIIPSSFEHL